MLAELLGEEGVYPVAIGAAQADALRGRVVRERAERTLDVGLGYGVATLALCQGLLEVGGDAHHVALDPNQETRFGGRGLRAVEEAGLAGLVEFQAEESQLALPRLVAEGRRFDLAFVDGNHRFDGVFLDLVHLGRLLRPGGVVVVDDLQLPAVARAVSYCVSNLAWTLEETSAADELHHWAVLRTSTRPDTRGYDDYADF